MGKKDKLIEEYFRNKYRLKELREECIKLKVTLDAVDKALYETTFEPIFEQVSEWLNKSDDFDRHEFYYLTKANIQPLVNSYRKHVNAIEEWIESRR